MNEAIDSQELLELKPVKHKKHISRRASEIIFVCLMLLFPVVQFIVFWIVPNFDSILLAFKLNESSSTLTLNNFKDFFEAFTSNDDYGRNPEIVNAIVNSLIYFAVSIFICTPLVIFLSYVLFRRVPFSGIFRVIFYLPSIIGVTVTATLFKALTSSGGPIYNLLDKLGLLNDQLKITGLYESLVPPGYEHLGFVLVLIYSIWTCVGINMILFHGAMRRIPQEIFESADIDGVGFFRQFFSIVIPLIWPTIATLIVFSLSSIFVSYGTIMLLTPNNDFSTMIGWYIFKRVDNGEFVYPAAVGLIFTIIGMPFVLLVRWGLNKIGSNVEY